jgi:hypothetical protein
VRELHERQLGATTRGVEVQEGDSQRALEEVRAAGASVA